MKLGNELWRGLEGKAKVLGLEPKGKQESLTSHSKRLLSEKGVTQSDLHFNVILAVFRDDL